MRIKKARGHKSNKNLLKDFLFSWQKINLKKGYEK